MARTARRLTRMIAGTATAATALSLGVLWLALSLSVAIPGSVSAQEQSRPGGFAPDQVEGIEGDRPRLSAGEPGCADPIPERVPAAPEGGRTVSGNRRR